MSFVICATAQHVVRAQQLDRFFNGEIRGQFFVLPDRIRDLFRKAINESQVAFDRYYFVKETSKEDFPEQGKRKIRICYTMAPYVDGHPVATSPLYRMESETRTEEIPKKAPETPQGFFQQLILQIMQFIRNVFARLCFCLPSSRS